MVAIERLERIDHRALEFEKLQFRFGLAHCGASLRQRPTAAGYRRSRECLRVGQQLAPAIDHVLPPLGLLIARRRAGRHKAGDCLPDLGAVGCERLEQRHVRLGREHGHADVRVAVHRDIFEHRALCEMKRVFGQVIEDEGGGPFVLRPIRC